ncbi:Peroxisome biogenesis protein 22 [Platanthera guangdongensis]|uniref:Peroxisome biogenesis protein 22 n=1 Tax=Platanthera guangdongensis TaxID=2320717 RepID=A0ABR2MC51_9ASPA
MSTFHFPSLLDSVYEMTCQLLCVILEEKCPEELQKHDTVRHSVVEILVEIANCCDFYLLERVLDDESEINSQRNFLKLCNLVERKMMKLWISKSFLPFLEL